MNQGYFTLTSLRRNQDAAMLSGTIQSARTSFTVVAIASAAAPYSVEAPTTELVSWIASAAQSPNCSAFNPSHLPMIGKVSSAQALRVKTAPSDTDISSSLAPTLGPMAAMALPPQIAVPTEMSSAVILFTPSEHPNQTPKATVTAMLMAVSKKQARLTASTWCQSMPKPSPTTHHCSNTFDAERAESVNGWRLARPTSVPPASAIAGEPNEVATASATRNATP